ncbi:glycosyltransferase [Marinobacterium nitratireducens]|uniref:glycosyltransferase n=1 Tax=Marinobacterium nitratireducens TaxID=518897 RepID=UPI001666F381|nr:glycosyltransferase [Marinobacterium nitratireducens]
MRVLLIAGTSSIHTIRWAAGIHKAGAEVFLATQHGFIEPLKDDIGVHRLPFKGNIGYFLNGIGIRSFVDRIKPDIVNVHYASGYGTTARILNYHPYVLSIWGSDIFDFPDKSRLHKKLVRGNLMSADAVASTSHCMALQARKIAPSLGEIAITPFGVDVEAFLYNKEAIEKVEKSQYLVVGTVKVLAFKYGIDTLIYTFAQTVEKLQIEMPEIVQFLRLRIVGDGPDRAELESLACTLGIGGLVQFVGRVAHSQVPRELDKMDIFVALSRLDSESFGVAVVEAGAAGRPVVVSDAGGLPEVVRDGETGLVVPREDPVSAADALIKLIKDRNLRIRLGQNGRQHVIKNYSWNHCIDNMISLYEKTIFNYKSSK